MSLANTSLTEPIPISTPTHSPAQIGVAAVLPSLFGILLFVLLILSVVVPKAQRHLSDGEIKKKMKDRFVILNKTARPLSYERWCKQMKLEHPENVGFEEPVCVICLEVIDKNALVRGLQCHHVFHQSCLDGWFGRLHDYCPLCHRLIVARDGGAVDENEAEQGSIYDQDFLIPPTQYLAPTEPVVESVPVRT